MALAPPGHDAPPLVVIAHDDSSTTDGLRHAVEAAGWWAAVAQPGPAGLAAAFATRPAVALVGCALLDEVPPGSDVPLLAVGDDTSSADLHAARDAGALGLVTWPDGVADLAVELAKAATGEAAVGEARSPVVAVRGVQGGAGTTTLAAHLAGAWARWGPAPVLLAISNDALHKASAQVRSWRLHLRIGHTLIELAHAINPIVRGWMQYYGAFYSSALHPFLKRINAYLLRWLRKKYKRLHGYKRPSDAGTALPAATPACSPTGSGTARPGDQGDKSPVSREAHAGICGSRGVQLPPATRPGKHQGENPAGTA
jgi:hypothetical protein